LPSPRQKRYKSVLVVFVERYQRGIGAMAGGKLAELLDHPEELMPLLEMAVSAQIGKRKLPKEGNLRFCYDMLPEVSRRQAVDQLTPAAPAPLSRPPPLDSPMTRRLHTRRGSCQAGCSPCAYHSL